MSQSKKGKRKTGILLMMLLCGTVVGGLTAYVVLGPGSKAPQIQPGTYPVPSSAQGISDDAAQREVDALTEVQIPIVQFDKNMLRFASEKFPLEKGQDPLIVAVQEFLKKANITDAEARIVAIKRDLKVAELHFNAAIRSGYGSQDEATLLIGLRAVMGQFPTIDEIEIFADGSQIDTLGGHVEIAGPLPVIRVGKWFEPTKLDEVPDPAG